QRADGECEPLDLLPLQMVGVDIPGDQRGGRQDHEQGQEHVPDRRKGPELGVGQPGDADRVDGPLQTLPVVVGRETDLAGDDVARRQQTNGDSQPHEQTPPLRRRLPVGEPEHQQPEKDEPGPAEALEHAEDAARLAGDDEMLLMAALNGQALILADRGELNRAVAVLETAIEIAVRTGHRHREAALWSHLADIHHRAGREDEARELQTRAISMFADIDAGGFEPELWLLTRW